MLDTIKKVNRKKIEQASFVCLFCYALFFISCNGIESTKGRRILTISQNCTLTPKKEVGPHDTPIFAASFPGSGARVGWQLIQGLTGKPIGDEWNSNGLGRNVIAVKTHWPHPTHGHQIEWENDIKRVFLLVRNPMYALSGFHNVIYSSTHNDELGSNVIAPTLAWMKWRDSNFNKQIFLWRMNIQYWLDNYKPENRLVTPYERIEDEIDGTAYVVELNQFLVKGGALMSELVPCVWSKVVQQKGIDLEEHIKDHHNTVDVQKRMLYHAPERSYTKEQYDQMIVVVRSLRSRYGDEKRLDHIFTQYEAVISKARDGQNYNDLFIHR